MLVLETCCCGLFSLKTGTRIISMATIVVVFLQSLGIVIAFVNDGKSIVRVLLYFAFVMTYVIFASVAFYNTFKERPLPSLLIPFLAVQVLSFLALLISIVALMWLDISQGGLTIDNVKWETADTLAFELGAVVADGILYYFFLVVYGYYKEVQRGTEPQKSPRPT